MIPLEVRFHHNPESTHGFVGAALSSVMWHCFKDGDEWKVEKVIEVAGQGTEGLGLPGAGPDQRPGRLDGRPLALLLELAARRRSPVRHQRSVEAEADGPGLGRRRCSGKAPTVHGKLATGGPQMLQLSLDGKRLYVTDSLVQQLGQPVLSEHRQARLADAAARRRHGEGRAEAERELPRRFRQGARRAGAGPRDALPGGRFHVGRVELNWRRPAGIANSKRSIHADSV